MKFALLLASALCVTAAHAVVFDDFLDPYTNSISSSTWVDFQAGGMVGGERDVMLSVLTNPLSQYLDLDIPGVGVMVVSNGFMTEGVVALQYDGVGDEALNTGSGNVLTNGGTGVPLIGGADDRIRIKFIGNDLDVTVTVTARLSGVSIGTNSGVRLGGSGAGNLDILMSPLVLSTMDSLTVEFSGVPSADFAIERIESVPEPATLLALATGAAALIRRRRTR